MNITRIRLKLKWSCLSQEDGKPCKNVIIFVADMSSSVHVDNKKSDILIFVKILTQGLDNTKLTAETKYHINCT